MAQLERQLSDTGDHSVLKETSIICIAAIPMAFAVVSFVGCEFVSVAVLGRVGTKYLSAASISQTWTESVRVFLNCGGVGTLCSQAWGAKNYSLVGVWFQISVLTGLVISIPVWVTYCLTSQVLGPLGYPQDELDLAGRYAFFIAFSVIPEMTFDRIFRYLQAFAVTTPTMLTMLFSVTIYGFIAVPLVYGAYGWPGLGYDGSPIAVTILAWIQFAMISILSFARGNVVLKGTWAGWRWSEITWARVGTYMKITVPNILQAGNELWRFQLLSTFAGLIGEVEMAAHMVGFRFIYIGYTFVYALSMAGGQRVGKFLGANRPDLAKRSCYVGATFAAVCAVSVAVLLIVYQHIVVRWFTQDPALIAVCERLTPKIAFAQIFMTLADYFLPMLNVQNRPNASLLASFLSSWFCHIPVSYVFVFMWYKDSPSAERIEWLWWGICAGYFAQCVIAFALVTVSDWPALAELAQRTNEVEETSTLGESLCNDEGGAGTRVAAQS